MTPRIEEIKSRLKAATPERWKAYRFTDREGRWLMGVDYSDGKDSERNGEYAWISTNITSGSDWESAEFIAHAPEDVGFLLGLVKRYREALENIPIKGYADCDRCIGKDRIAISALRDGEK